ncbi:hypothetical protein GCM10009001_07340 [Virgibacillus siamensis]|uniref:Transposase n=1 Tax=Virgibacillus siamensis TaxID=480071 RepID=A0ABN1FM31_9BACI
MVILFERYLKFTVEKRESKGNKTNAKRRKAFELPISYEIEGKELGRLESPNGMPGKW